MKLVRYEINLGIFRGILFGIREYDFESKDVIEKEIVIYVGIIQLIVTLIYNK
tara:strand:+ start:109 stop:267 length:159 start_codon:yes stop_codon:yes gene_type:complete